MVEKSTSTLRRIIHIDMDAFYASVEQLDNPSLRGLPVVVAWKGSRSVVCAASYEARSFGVRSAMPALRAERLCPDAVFVPPNFTRYKEVSAHVRDIFHRYTEIIEPLSLDEAYLDVTSPQGEASATQIGERIRADIFSELGLTASAGISYNKYLAKIASDWRKPNGLFVIPPSRALEFLAELPVGRLPGVGRINEEKLARVGVESVEDLRQLEADLLQKHFGKWGLRLFDLARGIDNSPVKPERLTSQISSEDTFPHDLAIKDLGPQIRRIASTAWAAYEREASMSNNFLARTVTLKLKTSDFRIVTRSRTYSSPITSVEDLISTAGALLNRIDLPEEQLYRLVGVGLSGISRDSPVQDGLFLD
ncbi:DNA polymerase IV [Pseudoxanthomonas mexicana]|uniref:DNA polymerase IV n=1 Tax=Pseudoxanthomonas mexicana TaxID=128785 RepID=UPI0009F952D5|nr:DNA polymerase IV [Pseudoxanthomonas mexicana]